MITTITAYLNAVERYRGSLTERLGRGDAEANLLMVKKLLARLPHTYLLAASKEEIQAAGRSMAAEGYSKEELRTLQNTLVGFLDYAFQSSILPFHPLRGLGERRDRITAVSKGALVAGFAASELPTIRSTLEAAKLEVHPETSESLALEHVFWYPFRFVVCRYPFKVALADAFFSTLRGPGSLCRNAGLVLVTGEADQAKAVEHVGRGANKVVLSRSLPEELPQAVRELSTVSRRTEVRVIVKAQLSDQERAEAWQSENISTTGMLARTRSKLSPGNLVELEFTLPGSGAAIRAQSTVVRRTAVGRERIDGLGLRFLSFEADGKYRLELFLTSRI